MKRDETQYFKSSTDYNKDQLNKLQIINRFYLVLISINLISTPYKLIIIC